MPVPTILSVTAIRAVGRPMGFCFTGLKKMQEQLSNSVGGAGQPRYVGFWARFFAFIVDSLWVGIFLAIVLFALYGDQLTAIVTMSPDASQEMVAAAAEGATGAILVELLLPAVIFVGFWMWKSATPGKMIVSAKIVDAKTLGAPSTGQLIVRYVGYFISSLFLCLGFLWIAFDARKQGWHDKIAGTVVIKA